MNCSTHLYTHIIQYNPQTVNGAKIGHVYLFFAFFSCFAMQDFHAVSVLQNDLECASSIFVFQYIHIYLLCQAFEELSI